MNRLARVGAVSIVAVALIFGSAAVGAAASPGDVRSLRVDTLDEVEPGSDELYGLAIDTVTRRAYVLDVRNRMVRAYDVSGGRLVAAGTTVVGTIDGRPNGLAVNETTHEVYTTDNSSGTDELVVVDGDPGSTTVGSVTRRMPTSGRTALALGVDAASHRVFVLNATTADVTVVDLDDGTTQTVPMGARPRDVVVDPVSQVAYVASTDGSRIVSIKPDGSWTITPLGHRPLDIEIVDNQLIVVSDDPFANHLDSYDPVSMAKTGSSAALAGPVSEIVGDPQRNVIYVVHAAEDTAAIEVVRTGDLTVEGATAVSYYGDAVLDRSSHRLITSRNGLSSKVLLLEPHLSPLPAVDRIHGADRFVTAAGVSKDSFSSGVPVAYVASGTAFPDALSGAAAAGAKGGPVLLVTKDGVPDATADELRRLRPRSIVVLGGTAAVSAATEKALSAFGGSVRRIAGPDRYAVSAAISADTHPGGAGIAFVASGEVFPDALSASPLTGREAGPVLLAQRASLPVSVSAELTRLKPSYIYVLGGTQAVGPEVVAELEKVAPVIRIDGSDRYAVSAAASARMFRPGTYTVYIASGEAFPDALAGAPAAVKDGSPVLLVNRDGIPAPIASELKRLSPYRIVVLGGPNAITERVRTELEGYLPE